MAYLIYKSDGTLFVTLEDGQINNADSSLTLIGKNVINFGQYQNTNFVKLLENFANTSAPSNPNTGQLWFDKNSDVLRMKVYNGSTWNSLPNLTISTSTPTLNYGDFWWDTDGNILYFQTTTTVAIAGPNFVASSATKLETARTINGIAFNGTASIVISSTTTNYLNFGSYITGQDFNGSSATTIEVDVGDVSQPTPNKVVARDSNGDIQFRIGVGTATASRFADLAEKYITDSDLEIGTVVTIGGDEEVTACNIGDRAIGVVSDQPGIMMNKDLVNGTYIALKGRVPIKVQGVVKKGQRLIAGDNGRAMAVNQSHVDVFAIALEDNDNKNFIEALIL